MRKPLLSFFAMVAFATPASALSLYYNVASPPVNTWTTESIPLVEGNWRVDNYFGNLFATQAQMQWVLGHLEGLYFLAEWYSVATDDTNVDNITMGSGASSSFGTDNGGWRVAGPNPAFDIYPGTPPSAPIPWDAGFGNPAGSVRTLDVYGWTYLSAPAAYLGNQSARYGESFSADIFIRVTDGDPYPILALVAPDIPEENADFDDNDEVDGRDFLIWQRNYGAIGQTGNSNGDANFDGTIDGDDLAVWENQYATPGYLAAVASPVPEPAAGMFVGVAALSWITLRRHSGVACWR